MKLLRVGIIVILALLFIPRTIHAEETGEVFFYQWDEEGEAWAVGHKMIFTDGCTMEDKAKMLYYSLIYRPIAGEVTYVPEGTKLNGVRVENGFLVLNLSAEAERAGGGEQERLYVEQITKTACSIEGIQGIMVLIEGREANLPEGTLFNLPERASAF